MSESDFKWINIKNIDDDIENINKLIKEDTDQYDSFNYTRNEGRFSYIFSLISTYPFIEFREFPHQSPTDANLEIYKQTFVNNILQVTHFKHGYNGLYPWNALFKCHTGNKTDIFYVWFEACCSYTGFEVYGDMTVWMSTDLDIIKNVVNVSN
jgi:hypothetical protein